jgi:hypothetical protein
MTGGVFGGEKKIFWLPGKAPPKFAVARPWWRRV